MIAVGGEALIDAYLVDDVLRAFPGGGPFNTAVCLARLQVPTSFVGGISLDPLGGLLMSRLSAAGVGLAHLTRTQAPTPMAIVDPSGRDARYSFYLNATAYQTFDADWMPDLGPDVTALHVGTLALATEPPAGAYEALIERYGANRAVVVDPNVRPEVIDNRYFYLERLERVFAMADIVKVSEADLAWIYPDLNELDAAEHVRTLGPPVVVVTRGAAGAVASAAEGQVSVEAPSVEVVDTVGAGDAFGAGLMAALERAGLLSKQALRDVSLSQLETALRYAVAVGALQCTRASAWAPSLSDLATFLEAAPSRLGWHPQHESEL